MNEEHLRGLVVQGMNALKAGCDTAERAQDGMLEAASHSDLKSTLEQGQKTTGQWRERIERALSTMGGDGDGPNDNPVQEALYEEEKRIRDSAPDDASRDLGIVAAGQQALHYWIASFGTMGAYAKRLGLSDVAEDMHACVEEAKRADETHNELATSIMR